MFNVFHVFLHCFFLRQLFSEGPGEDPAAAWGAGERVSLLWPSGRRAVLHTIVAHAHIKLLCLGPSMCECRVIFVVKYFVRTCSAIVFKLKYCRRLE